MYKVVEHKFKLAKDIEEAFNNLEKEGWELISFSGYVGQSVWKKGKDGCGGCGGECQCK